MESEGFELGESDLEGEEDDGDVGAVEGYEVGAFVEGLREGWG